ncbi:sensor histidine kinase [Solidesulfovibrio magneticus]|uniref:histidine kinase n=1 Tax=Solidesulfovibrio magneticus (strain ATCC 700980 / DSM 13731 / RS-1) TaxID=573370 RepID=C4XTI0_SOLM1|nr:PAS domain-containing sensor histidine kinase [Solidesulfovibrio magneticus]BAH75977.1 sensor histidine kinase [Solidesulfovibrio magneticus RS-1]
MKRLTRRVQFNAALDRPLLPILLTVFVGACLSTVLAYVYTKHVVEDLANAQIKQSLSLLDHEITVEVRDVLAQARFLSREKVLLFGLESSYLGSSAREAATRKLEEYIKDDVFQRYYLMNTNGQIVLASDQSLAGKLDVSDRRYYLQARAGEPTIETIAVSRVSGSPILVASFPIKSSANTVDGVLVIIRDTETFARSLLSKVRIGIHGGGFIIDENGVVLARPSWSSGNAFSVGEETKFIVNSAESNEIVNYVRDGVQRISLTKRNAITGWLLVVEAEKAEIVAPVNHLAAVNVGVSILILVVVAVSLNALRKVLKNLRDSESRFSSLFLLSPDSIMLTDLGTNKVLDVNERFLELFNTNRERIVGRNFMDVGLFLNGQSETVSLMSQEESVSNVEVVVQVAEGRELVFSMSCQTVDTGAVRYRMSVLRDITELHKAHEMMIQTEKMISIGGIAAGIAHEINNPLGIVLQAAQNIVQRIRLDFKKNHDVAHKISVNLEDVVRYIEARQVDVFVHDIKDAAVRASAIIRHMLDFSRKSESKRAVCDLSAIIERAVVLAASDYDLKKNYDFKRISIERDFPEIVQPIHCTETEIEQVILNILRNAAQALASADPPVASPKIIVRMISEADMVRVEIEDNGPGVPPEIQRRIFEPFYTTKAPGVGTGLGLSVSYFIVTKGHGGRMGVQSVIGEGAVFFIELPTDQALEKPL